MRIRQPRRLSPAIEQPPLGSNIVHDRLRIRLKYPITSEQWMWLVLRGWRAVDMRKDRRSYQVVDESMVRKLILAETPEERTVIYDEIMFNDGQAMLASQAKAGSAKSMRDGVRL